MERVAIVGVGLIGASFGLALRKAGFRGAIVGVSSPRSIAAGMACGAVDGGASLEEALSVSDLVFLSQPISGILETLQRLGPLVRPGTLITDVGSTKAVICSTALQHLGNALFVGGHPMAGKEQRGAEAASANLFVGRPWVLTSFGDHPLEVEFRQWIEKIGARLVIIDAATHDKLVAWSSHLPQLASTALGAALYDHQPDAATVGGPGLTDMTRLAMSSYDLWRDILETNQKEVAAALDAYIGTLQSLRDNFETAFAHGSEFAQTFRRKN